MALLAAPAHPCTSKLLDTIPDIEMTGRERAPVAGEIPNPISPPAGCTIHPQCPYAEERCRREAPRALPPRDGRVVACHGIEESRLPAAVGPGVPAGEP